VVLAPLDLVPALASGAVVTVGLTIGGIAVALFLAFAVGLLRLSPARWIRLAAVAYTELFRGSSLIVQLFFLFYVLPLFGLRFDSVATAILGLGLNSGAYGSEIVRGAVLAVDQGQYDGTKALNMSGWLAMRRVILPQAVVMMLPSFGNQAIQILKDTSLASLITIHELSLSGRLLVQAAPNRTDEIYTLVLITYLVLAYPLTRLVRAIEARATRGLHLGWHAG
jgi:polar amino acid transport system permease protein